MPPQTMRQFLKPPEKAPDTLPRTQSTMSLLDYFSTVIQGLADPTGWTEPKAEDFDNPHAYTQALKAHGVGQLLGMAAPLAAPLAVLTKGARTEQAASQTLQGFHQAEPVAFQKIGQGVAIPRGEIGEYAYHATNADNLHEIAASGKLNTHKPWDFTDQSVWPDGSTKKRAYFGADPEHLWQFAPEHGDPVIVRTKRTGAIRGESGTGDLYTEKPIKADALEYFGSDGQWHPVPSLKPPTAAPAAPQTLKAFHGSPHDFERFDASKIGTGEGAQAYGHGLYFAGGEDTAKYYRDALEAAKRRSEPVVYAGTEYTRGTGFHQVLVDIADKGKEATIESLKKDIEFNRDYAPTQAALKEHFLEFAQRVDPEKLSLPKGKMYELNLHTSPESLLDWDKPLSQQPQKVQEALAKLELSRTIPGPVEVRQNIYGDKQFYLVNKASGEWGTQGFPTKAAAEAAAPAQSVRVDLPEDATGEQVYQHLVGAAGGRAGHTEGIASKQLSDAGIHGVQYLDQGSRTTGQVVKLHGKYYFSGSSQPYETMDAAEKAAEAMAPRTRNYVIFPHFEHLIEISKKYGISLPAAASLYKWQQSHQQKGVE